MSEVAARLKPLGRNRNYYRALCGNPRCAQTGGVPGLIGEVHGPPTSGVEVKRLTGGYIDRLNGREPRPRHWYLTHPNGLRADGDYFRVGACAKALGVGPDALGAGRPIGRRRIPWGLRGREMRKLGRRGFIGEYPALPAVVICPSCAINNRVEPPTIVE